MASDLFFTVLLIFATMFLLMFLGTDIFVSMGIAAVAYLLVTGNAPLTLIPQNMINGISGFSLLAIPFFMLTGDLMNISGMTLRLVNFAKFFIGRIRGCLAYTCVFVNIIAAGVSGSGPADCSMVSSVMLPAMKKDNYPEDFSAALNASAAVVGPIIPPSIPMVFIAMLTNLSVGKLLFGGVIPGLLFGGIVFAPKPRDYTVTLNKKVKRLAMKSALSSKVQDNEMIVVDSIATEGYKTKKIAEMLKALGSEKKALIVLSEVDAVPARNIDKLNGHSRAAAVECLGRLLYAAFR